jgi:hypothetical protein
MKSRNSLQDKTADWKENISGTNLKLKNQPVSLEITKEDMRKVVNQLIS